MVIEQINAQKLLIVLEEKDMRELDITYESISWSDRKSRDVIAKLLTLAKLETGFSIDNNRLSIETLPQFGGCVIIFNLVKDSIDKAESAVETKVKMSSNVANNVLIYRVDKTDDLLELCKHIYKLHNNNLDYKSDIYTYKDKYYVVIRFREEIKRSMYILLEEYGELLKQNKLFISYLDEYGKILKKDNAIISIGKSM